MWPKHAKTGCSRNVVIGFLSKSKCVGVTVGFATFVVSQVACQLGSKVVKVPQGEELWNCVGCRRGQGWGS